MNKYIITLNQDYCFLKNHIIISNLIDKGVKDLNIKSYQSGLREITLITEKEIEEIKYEIKYPKKTLMWKVEKQVLNENRIKKGDHVLISGLISLSFTPLGEKKEKSYFEVSTGKLIHKEQFEKFVLKQLGLSNFSFNVKTFVKTPLEDNKVVIYNKVFLEVEGVVIDEELVNQLNFKNIGKMKSYGLGALKVKKK